MWSQEEAGSRAAASPRGWGTQVLDQEGKRMGAEERVSPQTGQIATQTRVPIFSRLHPSDKAEALPHSVWPLSVVLAGVSLPDGLSFGCHLTSFLVSRCYVVMVLLRRPLIGLNFGFLNQTFGKGLLL